MSKKKKKQRPAAPKKPAAEEVRGAAGAGRGARKPEAEGRRPQEEIAQDSLTQLSSPEERGGPVLPVAGIGASAGGLDAFKKFFGTMPADSGIAFVLLPHLDPTHESLMAELLARYTSMPVAEAEDGTRVEANHVYIIPPNKYMTISGGVLRLTGPVQRRDLQTSIDPFLRSLAQDQQERAICIILSGTGAHGTLGLKAVKAAGGMAMVQDPKTAEYDRMPHSAIATGLADFVLPPEKMPQALVKFVQHFYVNGGRPQLATAEAPDFLPQFLALLRTRTKFDFTCYRKNMLTRRIERRMGLNQIQQLADYLAYLRAHPEEIKHLTRDLFISVTSFFRDPEAWQALETQVLPALLESKEADAPIRVWVPGCATGEEAYSIAMLLLEQLTADRKSYRLQIFASDVDEEALEVARQGIYPESIFADVSPERLSRFFTRADDNTYQVNKQVREAVAFAAQNLIFDPPFSKLDLISCRNLLIYLEPDVQKKVVSLLHFALNPGGYLFLGPSETIGRQVDLFEPLHKKWRVFRRIGPNRPDRVDFPILHLTGVQKEVTPPALAGRRPPGIAELTQQMLLEEYAPAAVLINRRHEILYFFGPTMCYLDQPSGEPTLDLLTLARDALRTRLRAVVHKVIHENRPVTEQGIRLKRNGATVSATLTVRPIHLPKAPEGLLLVTFTDEPEPSPHVSPPKRAAKTDESQVQQLEYDLKAIREDLQSTIEEMESSNEELKAANEEVMSMNEELQSANEELETSKEELQSLNEELNTVNSQLQDKVDELERANDDMANLLNCSDIGTVFLDAEFHIKRFTPAATQLFNLLPSDLGRPLADIAPKFKDPNLPGDARQVLQKLVPVEKEVEAESGRWCVRRILPYRTKDNRIEGVVITFVDITERKRNSEALLEVERRFRLAVEAAPNAMIMVDTRGQIVLVNSQTEKLFGYPRKELASQPVEMLVPERLRAQHRHDRATFLSDPQARPMGQGRDLFGRRKDGSEFPVEIGLSPVQIKEDLCVLAGIVDITQRKEAEAELHKLNELLKGQLAEATWSEQRRLGQELHDTVGQELTGLSLIAHSLERKLQIQKLPESAQMAEILQGLQKVIGHVREISRGMIPVEVDAESFSSALADLASQTGQRHGIECALECDGSVAVHDNQAAAHLYRIAQEAITNAIKHGRAKNIKLSLEEQNEHLVLGIGNDGDPFQPESETGTGLGLRIMRYRAGLIGATLDIGEAKDGQTVVTCSLKK